MTEVQRFLSARVRQSWSPGVAWWIERDGSVCDRGACGVASSVPRRAPLSEATPYDLASLTKPLATGLLLGRQTARGLIRALLPPRLRGSLAILWTADGKPPPPGANRAR